jgi:hypothetical protein
MLPGEVQAMHLPLGFLHFTRAEPSPACPVRRRRSVAIALEMGEIHVD